MKCKVNKPGLHLLQFSLPYSYPTSTNQRLTQSLNRLCQQQKTNKIPPGTTKIEKDTHHLDLCFPFPNCISFFFSSKDVWHAMTIHLLTVKTSTASIAAVGAGTAAGAKSFLSSCSPRSNNLRRIFSSIDTLSTNHRRCRSSFTTSFRKYNKDVDRMRELKKVQLQLQQQNDCGRNDDVERDMVL